MSDTEDRLGSEDGGRPSEVLPARQLVRISLYWLGLSSIFAGLNVVMLDRLVFEGLAPDRIEAGELWLRLTFFGTFIAIVVQPTVGMLSDYTATRWGRRKPYILIGTVLDLVFLTAIAFSHQLVAIAVFIALLQFSSNFAQGPFQGYVPDLVPARQVGLASAVVGMMQIFGNVSGVLIAAISVLLGQPELGLIALGLLELVTMVAVVVGVRDSRPATPRRGRSWPSIALGAWGTDILHERSYVWLLGSRLAILMAGGILTGLGLLYLTFSLEYTQELTAAALLPVTGLIALGTVAAVVPAARLSDRIGRKRVIYGSCAIGAIGLGIVGLAPLLYETPAVVAGAGGTTPDLIDVLTGDPRYRVALLGVVIFGLSQGAFLAVDWALMSDIIPKASSGRYMGISNVATGLSGLLAVAIGGTAIRVVAEIGGEPAGPVAAMGIAVLLLLLGVVLLVPVDERRREDDGLVAGEASQVASGVA
jgi:MFS family permease